MYSPWGFEICNQIRKKLLLKDLIAVQLLEPNEEVIISDKSQASGNQSVERGNVFLSINSIIVHYK